MSRPKQTIVLPEIRWGRCPACTDTPLPQPHTSRFGGVVTFHCRTGNQQVRATAIEPREVDAVFRTTTEAEIHAEIFAGTGPETIILLALREILRHTAPTPYTLAISCAIDQIVTVETDAVDDAPRDLEL